MICSDSLLRVADSQETGSLLFHDSASAAEAAAESAEKAVAAAQAAAYIANRDLDNYPNSNYSLEAERFLRRRSDNVPPAHSNRKLDDSNSFGGTDFKGSDDLLSRLRDPKTHRRHSYNAPSVNSDVRFDESDLDDGIETDRLPPPMASSRVRGDPVPRVHPKLPDYDDLAARFEALKYRK